MSVKTMCNGCVFADVDDWVQTGCYTHRLELFKDKELDPGLLEKVAKYYVLDGVCNMYRKDDGTEIQDQERNQRELIKPRFTYFVIFGKDNSLADLNDTLQSIDEGSDVRIIDLRYETGLRPFIEGYKLKIVVSSKLPSFQVMRDDVDISDELFLSENMGKIKNSMICVVHSGYSVSGNIECDLDDLINVQMKLTLIYSYPGCYVVNSAVAKKLRYFLHTDLKEKLESINE